jgi:hypothetical protein
MNDILEEFDKYISSNKEVLSVLPVNTKKNRSIYVQKVEELEEKALQMKKVIWNEIQERYEKILDTKENPHIAEISDSINNIKNIELFNELNTSFEKLEFDKITHNLSCFFEADLTIVNKNIKLFIEKFREFGIALTENDFTYSSYVNEYMRVFFEETSDGSLNTEKLKKTFETIYWKCPDIVTHIELNIRYLYNINSKKIEKDLKARNDKVLESMSLDKNGLVKRFFELNKELIKLKRIDQKAVLSKFANDEWKIKDFNDKEMSVLYDRLYSKNYYSASPEEQDEIDSNFGKLLNTLQEYSIYVRYKYIIDDLKNKYKNKDSFKDAYEKKAKELHKKEQELLKENKKNTQLAKISKNPLLVFFKKKIDRKIYEAPANVSIKIKEIKKLYLELDEEAVNKRIIEFVDDNCTIKYMFKIAISFYTYAYNLVKEHYKDDPDVNVEEELQVLIDFINQPYKVMLNNIKLVEEPDIRSIISNRYKILNISLEQESLEDDNIESLITDVEKIVDFYNIRKSGLNIEDIEFIQKVKPMINKK